MRFRGYSKNVKSAPPRVAALFKNIVSFDRSRGTHSAQAENVSLETILTDLLLNPLM
jgi:hypothetical protein